MKNSTLFVVCSPTTDPAPIEEKLGKILGSVIKDPQTTHDAKSTAKILYWQDMEFTDTYNVQKIAIELGQQFPSFTVFHITRPAPKSWGWRHGWWLGIAATIATALAVWLLG